MIRLQVFLLIDTCRFRSMVKVLRMYCQDIHKTEFYSPDEIRRLTNDCQGCHFFYGWDVLGYAIPVYLTRNTHKSWLPLGVVISTLYAYCCSLAGSFT